MEAQENQVALPLRSHTILGACEAVGEDFGFNPMFRRVPFAAMVLWSPLLAIAAYLGLCGIVLASRLLFPSRRRSIEAAQPTTGKPSAQTNDVVEEEKVP